MFLNLSTLKLLIFSLFLLPGILFAGPAEPGFTISLSIRNEMTYTMQQAINWLIAKQSSNGTWQIEGKSPYFATTLVRFSLSAMRQPESDTACKKASEWLIRHPVPPKESLSAYTWHLMGDRYLSQGMGSTSAETLRKAAEAALPTATPGELERWYSATGDSEHRTGLRPHRPAWPFAAECTYLELWETARTINRHFRGTLLSERGEHINWQQELARRLINSQKRDFSSEGCYWAAQGTLSAIEQTAYALFLYLEL